jgi:hypothetical protein
MFLAVGQTFEQRQHASLIVWDRHLPLLICDDLLGYAFREYKMKRPYEMNQSHKRGIAIGKERAGVAQHFGIREGSRCRIAKDIVASRLFSRIAVHPANEVRSNANCSPFYKPTRRP